MANSNQLTVRPITSGWEFVNLFYDRQKVVFYCRVRKVEPEKNHTDWPEITGIGATMQIAFDNAIATALA